MYHVDISNSGDDSFKVSSQGYEFTVGMKGQPGVTPPDALLASLGTCIGVYLRKYTEGLKIPLPEFDIRVSAEFSQDKHIGFRKIQVEIDLKGAVIEERKRSHMMEFIKNCPVHNTLKNPPEIEIGILPVSP